MLFCKEPFYGGYIFAYKPTAQRHAPSSPYQCCYSKTVVFLHRGMLAFECGSRRDGDEIPAVWSNVQFGALNHQTTGSPSMQTGQPIPTDAIQVAFWHPWSPSYAIWKIVEQGVAARFCGARMAGEGRLRVLPTLSTSTRHTVQKHKVP